MVAFGMDKKAAEKQKNQKSIQNFGKLKLLAISKGIGRILILFRN